MRLNFEKKEQEVSICTLLELVTYYPAGLRRLINRPGSHYGVQEGKRPNVQRRPRHGSSLIWTDSYIL